MTFNLVTNSSVMFMAEKGTMISENLSLSLELTESSSWPRSLEGLDVIQESAVMMGRPLTSFKLFGDAVSLSLWTFGRRFMRGS